MDGGAWWAAVHGVAKSRARLSDFTFPFHFHALEKEMGNPLQCSCLENPRDGGAWWAAIYGVARSRTRLKRLSSNVVHIQPLGMLDISKQVINLIFSQCSSLSHTIIPVQMHTPLKGNLTNLTCFLCFPKKRKTHTE